MPLLIASTSNQRGESLGPLSCRKEMPWRERSTHVTEPMLAPALRVDSSVAFEPSLVCGPARSSSSMVRPVVCRGSCGSLHAQDGEPATHAFFGLLGTHWTGSWLALADHAEKRSEELNSRYEPTCPPSAWVFIAGVEVFGPAGCRTSGKAPAESTVGSEVSNR